MTEADAHEQIYRLSTESLAAGDPTGWYERLYAVLDEHGTAVPWDRAAPHPLLVDWAQARALDGVGRRALVVGCGLGADAEYVAGLGFDTVAFDVSPTAVRAVRRRFPHSSVRYRTADLLDPPSGWRRAFDLVVEIHTIQSLPDPVHRPAIGQLAGLVGGTLFVVAKAREERDGQLKGPPWPLTRTEIESFATGGLQPVRVEAFPATDRPGVGRWRAEFRRPDRDR